MLYYFTWNWINLYKLVLILCANVCPIILYIYIWGWNVVGGRENAENVKVSNNVEM